MKKSVVATIVLFTLILGSVWVLSVRAAPVMLDVDAAQLRHHP